MGKQRRDYSKYLIDLLQLCNIFSFARFSAMFETKGKQIILNNISLYQSDNILVILMQSLNLQLKKPQHSHSDVNQTTVIVLMNLTNCTIVASAEVYLKK